MFCDSNYPHGNHPFHRYFSNQGICCLYPDNLEDPIQLWSRVKIITWYLMLLLMVLEMCKWIYICCMFCDSIYPHTIRPFHRYFSNQDSFCLHPDNLKRLTFVVRLKKNIIVKRHYFTNIITNIITSGHISVGGTKISEN